MAETLATRGQRAGAETHRDMIGLFNIYIVYKMLLIETDIESKLYHTLTVGKLRLVDQILPTGLSDLSYQTGTGYGTD